MIWKDINITKPLATETGEWDGKKSDEVLVYTKNKRKFVASMYHVIIDGIESFDFYDDRDFDIKDVILWTEIEEPFNLPSTIIDNEN